MNSIKGGDELEKNLASLKNSGDSYKKALLKFLLRVERNSAKRVPIDTSNLQKSGLGTSNVSRADSNGASGTVGYRTEQGESNYFANYAVYVHERTDLRHTNGEAKFLENALKEEAGKLEKIVGNELKFTMFKGG